MGGGDHEEHGGSAVGEDSARTDRSHRKSASQASEAKRGKGAHALASSHVDAVVLPAFSARSDAYVRILAVFDELLVEDKIAILRALAALYDIDADVKDSD